MDNLMETNDDEQCIAAFNILVTLVKNIIKDTKNEKFRKIKKSNKSIQTKLMNLNSEDKVINLLETLGYVQDEDDEDVYTFEGEYYAGIIVAARLLDDQIMRLKMKTMSEEDRKKQEEIFQARDQYFAVKKAKLQEKKQYQNVQQYY